MKSKINSNVARIFSEYEQLSKIQRNALFSQPVSINLLNSYENPT